MQIEDRNNSVTNYAKSSTHLYTLWSVLSNEEINLPTIDILASKYNEFMQRVTEISQSATPEQFLNGPDSELYTPAFRYAENARGANTEEPQRRIRKLP